jgi:hypothetical protein
LRTGAAIQTPRQRIIDFKFAGVIALKSTLNIEQGILASARPLFPHSTGLSR